MADASLDDNNQFAPLFKNSKCTLFSNKRYQNHFNKSSFVLFSFFSWKLKWETCKKKKIKTFFRISEAHFKFGRMKKFFCEWQKKMLDRNNLLVFSFFFVFSLSLSRCLGDVCSFRRATAPRNEIVQKNIANERKTNELYALNCYWNKCSVLTESQTVSDRMTNCMRAVCHHNAVAAVALYERNKQVGRSWRVW